MLTIREELGGRVLERDGAFITCDSDLLRRFYSWVIPNLTGDVVMTGLGLSVALDLMGRAKEITSVTVLEIDPEIVRLSADRMLLFPKVDVYEADAWVWDTDRHFDWALHDIWSDIHAAEVPAQESRLKTMWSSRIKSGQVTVPSAYKEFISGASC